MVKTNAMRILEREKVSYTPHTYDDTVLDGQEVARLVGQPFERVFKTLVTTAGEGKYAVFVLSVGREFEEGGAGGGRKGPVHAAAKNAPECDGVCARRVLARGDEKEVPDGHRRGGARAGDDFCQRRAVRRADRGRAARSGPVHGRRVCRREGGGVR